MPEDRLAHSRPTVGPEEAEAVARVLRSGPLVGGPEVQGFESEMASRMDRKFARATSSGTAALHLALLALGAGPGTEVVLPSYVCAAVLNAVRYTGARPVPADCAPGSVNASAAEIAPRLTARTRAVVWPHLFGIPADLPAAKDWNVPVIEDCAMALGATLGGRPAGAFGRLTVCSFYATKVITTGHGGMVLGDDPDLLAVIDDRMSYDNRETYTVVRHNYGPTALQAAMGRVQLRRLDDFAARRRAIAERYRDALCHTGLGTVPSPPGAVPMPYRWTAFVRGGAGPLRQALAAAGIDSPRPVFRPIHRYLAAEPAEFPHAERAHDEIISLPIYPSLTDADADRVIAAVRRALA